MSKGKHPRPTKSVAISSKKTGSTQVVEVPRGRNESMAIMNKDESPVDDALSVVIVTEPPVLEPDAHQDVSGDIDPENSIPSGQALPHEATTCVSANFSDIHMPPGWSTDQSGVKRVEPRTIAEYVKALYGGSVKSLSEQALNRLKNSTHAIPSEERSCLLRLALETDKSLEKTKLLLLAADRCGAYKGLGQAFRSLARDVLLLHPVAQGNPTISEFFHGIDDRRGLRDLWSALYGQPSSVSREKPIEQVGEQTSDQDGDAQAEEKNASKQLAKARRNMFLCGALWRGSGDSSDLQGLIQALGTTLFRLSSDAPVGGALLSALATAAEKEDERIALLIAWSVGQTGHLNARIADLGRRLQTSEDALSRTQRELASTRDLLDEREIELSAKDVQLKSQLEDTGVQKTHARADYEALRADSMNVIKAAVAELENVDVALSREIPKTYLAREVVQAVVDSLIKHVESLEQKRL